MAELGDWTALAERTLRGGDLSDLASVLADGISVQPLYVDAPPTPDALRQVDAGRVEWGWDVRVSYGQDCLERAASHDVLAGWIRQDLNGGATSVELDVGGASVDDLDVALAGVDLAVAPVALAPHNDLDAAKAFCDLAARRGTSLAAGSSLGLSSRAAQPAPGRSGGPSDSAASAVGSRSDSGLAEWAASTASLGSGVRVFTVDAVGAAEAGATEAEALGQATAAGVALLRQLTAAGLSVDEAANLIGFRFAATADQFVTIAALRAARVIWARVVSASGGSEAGSRQYQHAITPPNTYSIDDPWINLLRGSAAALAAGAAGADAVTVLPLDHGTAPVDADGSLGRRLARNTQLLLLQESHIARTCDPAAGSFYVESLTDQLARAAWQILISLNP